VALDGKVVSSTRIREAIQSGHLDDASQMLGRTYGIVGKVVEGNRLGRQLGFPTANLETSGLTLPPNGVYAAHVRWKRARYRGAVNIGVRPTLNTGISELRVEVHLLDFNQDIYGEELEVQMVERVRGEQQFASLDELKEQICRDIEAVRGFF
jgi:riboflavin kinase/FMN adenylyltransferase